MLTISRSLDLAGTPCPMNFVLLKQTLDAMPAGENLQVRLDRASAERDVAASLAGCGYDIVSVREEDGYSLLVVRRRMSGVAGFMPRPGRRRGGCTKSNRRRR